MKFALNGEFLSIDSPTLPCQFLNNVRFGVNYSKKCKINIAELLNARVELLSPYLVFSQNNKSFIHPLPVIVKSMDQVRDQVSTLHFDKNNGNDIVMRNVFLLYRILRSCGSSSWCGSSS